MKSSVVDVIQHLQTLLETRDSLLTVTFRQHLAEKLKPMFSMLNHLEGVSESGSLLKQGGEVKKTVAGGSDGNGTSMKSPPKSQDAKVNVALGSKRRGKSIDDDDDDDNDDEEEEEHLSEKPQLKRKKHDQELDENLRVAREAEAREREARDAQLNWETKKVFFPSWSRERILNEVIDNPNVYWLELRTSFKQENILGSQLDFLITPKAFLFRYFDKVAKAPYSDNSANLMLISFNLNMESLSTKPGVQRYFFLLRLLDAQKFELILEHLKRMFVSYILEIAKIDMEIVPVLRKKPTVQPKETLKDHDNMQKGKILKDNWSMAYQERNKACVNVQRCCFFFPDKHLYFTSCLEYVLGLSEACKENNIFEKKCIVYMLKWYITVRNTFLGLMENLFKVQKPIQQ
ncbi:unnamed protein product [Lactuca saligna]|uniref:Uncharacterized protein n=1 Tax=Lactuca saligna TaxID=75948 RepID=A0AA36EMT7_LACSI|nr:unnamed protein product [Lactuca saligna]